MKRILALVCVACAVGSSAGALNLESLDSNCYRTRVSVTPDLLTCDFVAENQGYSPEANAYVYLHLADQDQHTQATHTDANGAVHGPTAHQHCQKVEAVLALATRHHNSVRAIKCLSTDTQTFTDYGGVEHSQTFEVLRVILPYGVEAESTSLLTGAPPILY